MPVKNAIVCEPWGTPLPPVLLLALADSQPARRAVRAVLTRRITCGTAPGFDADDAPERFAVPPAKIGDKPKALAACARYVHALRYQLVPIIEAHRGKPATIAFLRRLAPYAVPLAEAEQALIASQARVILHAAVRVAKRWGGDTEDMVSEGTLIAYDALDYYDPARRTSFTTIVYQRLFWVLPRICCLSLAHGKGAAFAHDDDACGRLAERTHPKADAVEAVAGLLGELPDLERAVVSLYAGVNGCPTTSLHEIGRVLKLSERRALRALTTALASLREAARRIDLPEGIDVPPEAEDGNLDTRQDAAEGGFLPAGDAQRTRAVG